MRLSWINIPGAIVALGLWVSVCFGASARLVSGIVKDRSGSVMPGVLVTVRDSADVPMSFARSGAGGAYRIECADSVWGKCNLVFSFLGYKKVSVPMNRVVDGGTMVMDESSIELAEVVVRVPPITARGDTLTFDVSSFKGLSDRKIEDVLKKMPGISVADNGRIYYNGEAISKFYIEDLDAVGSRYVMATRNISADDVASVNVYENHQAKRVLRDVESSDKAAINLKLKRKSLLKPIGYVEGGGGVDADGSELWIGEAFGMLIGKNSQVLATVKSNNAGKSYREETANMIAGKGGSTVAYGMYRGVSAGGVNIPSSRYLSNTSLMSSVSSLVRLNKYMTLAINADYTDDNSRYDKVESVSYVGSGGADVVFNESTRGRAHGREGKFNVRLENNSPGVYVKNATSFAGHFNNSRRDVSNGNNITQSADVNDCNFRNVFEGIFRMSRSMVEMKADVEVGTTPVNRLEVERNGVTDYIAQNLKGMYVNANARTGYSWFLTRSSSIGLNAVLESRYDEFDSRGECDGELQPANRVAGYYMSLIAEPTYRYRSGSDLQVKLLVPVRVYHSKFANRITDKDYRTDRVDADVKATVSYNMDHNVKMVCAVGYQSRLGGLSDYIVNPVYVDYNQSTSMGNGSMDLRKSCYVTADVSYRNAMAGLFTSLSAVYRYGTSDRLSGLDVSQDEIVSGVTRAKNHTDMVNVHGMVSKKIFSWNTLLSLDAGWEYMSKTVLRNSGVLGLETMSYVLNPMISSTPIRQYLEIGVDVKYSRMVQKMPAVGFDTGRSDMSCRLSLSTHPVKALEVSGSLWWGRNEISEGVHKSDVFVDCGMKYEIGKLELSLSARNLCNTRSYGYSYLRDSNRYYYSFSLRPMEIIAALKVSF